MSVKPPFFTVSQREGTEGSEYVLTLTDTGQQVSIFDGEDAYWMLANLIDHRFGEVAQPHGIERPVRPDWLYSG